jgi:hypothetical protein
MLTAAIPGATTSRLLNTMYSLAHDNPNMKPATLEIIPSSLDGR